MLTNLLITPEWLRSVGFKWAQLERQPEPHWILWLDYDELGIELGPGAWNGERDDHDDWFCWLRSDTAGRYHRFIHIRHLYFRHEVEALVAAITGEPWNPERHVYGCWRTEKDARRLREEQNRLDLEWKEREAPWLQVEKDLDRARALPEHLQAAVDSGKAK